VRTSTSGLLLILLAVTALAGFLTGNLDRWLGYLFDPTRPGLGPGGTAGTGTVSLGATGSERRGANA
jgi:hypothetical protein